MRLSLAEIAKIVKSLARERNWKVDRSEVAVTGSVYIELVREHREWVLIRVADHAQYYKQFLTTYSVDPSSTGIDFEELEELLDRPFGEVGDVLLDEEDMKPKMCLDPEKDIDGWSMINRAGSILAASGMRKEAEEIHDRACEECFEFYPVLRLLKEYMDI